MLPHRCFMRKNDPTKQQILLRVLDNQKSRHHMQRLQGVQDEVGLLNWCECVVNEVIARPFDPHAVIDNYNEIQKVWKGVKSQKGKLRKAFIRLKLFVFCIQGNDEHLNHRISQQSGAMQAFLKGLSGEEWCSLITKVNIRVLVEYWMKNKLISKQDFKYFREIRKVALGENRRQVPLTAQKLNTTSIEQNETETNKNSVVGESKRDSMSRRSRNSSSKNSRSSIKSKVAQRRRSSFQDKNTQLISSQSIKRILIENRKSSFYNGRMSIDVNQYFRDSGKDPKATTNVKDVVQSLQSSSDSEPSEATGTTSDTKSYYVYISTAQMPIVVEVEQTQVDLTVRCRQLQLVFRIERQDCKVQLEEFVSSISIVKSLLGYSFKFGKKPEKRFTNKVDPHSFLSVDYVYSRYCFRQWKFLQSQTVISLYDRLMSTVFEEETHTDFLRPATQHLVTRTSLKHKQVQDYDNQIEQTIVEDFAIRTQNSTALQWKPIPKGSVRKESLEHVQLFRQLANKYRLDIKVGEQYMIIINSQYYKAKIVSIERALTQMAIKIKLFHRGFHQSYYYITETMVRTAKFQGRFQSSFGFIDVLKMYRQRPTLTYPSLVPDRKDSCLHEDILYKALRKYDRLYYIVTVIHKALLNKMLLKLYCQKTSTYLETMVEFDTLSQRRLTLSKLRTRAEAFVDSISLHSVNQCTYVKVGNKSLPLQMVFCRKTVVQGKHIYEQRCFITQNCIKSYPLELISRLNVQICRVYCTSMVKDERQFVQLKAPLERYFKTQKLLNPIKQTAPKISQYRFCRADIKSLSRHLQMTINSKLEERPNRFYKIARLKAMKFEVQDSGIDISRVTGQGVIFIDHEAMREKIPFYDQLLHTDVKSSSKRLYLSCRVISRFI